MHATTGRPPAIRGSASASAAAPAGLWAASRTSGGSPSITSIRPWSSRSAATSATRSGSSEPRIASVLARATAKLRRRYGAAVGELDLPETNLRPRPGARGARPRSGARGARPQSPEGRSPEWNGRAGRRASRRRSRARCRRGTGVLEPDRGQRGDPRREHVGRVEPTAEPGLDHPDLDSCRSRGRRTRRRSSASNWVTESPSSSARSTDRDRLRRPARRRLRRHRASISAPPIMTRSDQRSACGDR